MQNYKTKFIQLTLWLAFATTFISGQTSRSVESVIAVEANAAFVGVSIQNGTVRGAEEYQNSEDVNQIADIKTSEFLDFSFDGKTNCPLTIILNFNFAPSGALRYLELSKSNTSEEKTGKRNNDELLVRCN